MNQEQGLKSQEIYPDHLFHLPPAKGIDSPRWNNIRQFRRALVTEIPDGHVIGNCGSVITPNNEIFWDVCYPPRKKDQEELFQKLLPNVKYTTETVATLAWYFHNNYFHWFFDILPRIDLINKSGITVDKYIINGHQPAISQFKFETLSILGIPKEKIILADDTFHLKAKKLIVPSVPGGIGYPKWACDFIRSEFLDKNPHVKKISDFERIYISRDDASYRKVLNEDELMEFLAKHGFKKVSLSSLSLNEKISLFSSAKIIVSPISAALSNLVFCNPGTKVIEFSSINYICDVYWKIANYVYLDYYYMVCQGGASPAAFSNHDDIVVDINKMKKILDLAGI